MGATFLKMLTISEKLTVSLSEEIKYARLHYATGDTLSAYDRAMELEKLAEQLVLFTRELPVCVGIPQARGQVEQVISECIPVEIGYTAEGWFSLRIPALLPKKSGGSANYVRSFLYPAMRDFFRERSPVRYRDCILIYRHIYDRDRPERQMRDHDNIEINMVSDIVAMYVMPDDGPAVCAHYYCSREGPEDRTEVYVVPRDDFPAWLELEKTMPDSGVLLLKNGPNDP